MKIRHISIQNFRGIKELDWQINQALVCLIGQGDSTKSTILDAIHLCLWPSWSANFSDADFFNSETQNPIEIIATVGELPDSMISQDRFGDYLRGWSLERGIIDEPEDGTETVLSISLTIDDKLEPTWAIINEREPDGIGISANNRKKFGVNALGMYVDQDLSWGKYSSLSQLTSNDDDISTVLADASRRAREAVADAPLTELNRSAERVSEIAEVFGVRPHAQYNVGLDAKLSVTGQATLTLHDGQVPARMAGLGSRRLLTLAIQYESVPEGGILLVDEIEVGLEPHRLRHLIHKLRPNNESKQQVFITTHSNVAIEELNAEELQIVHNNEGIIDIQPTHHSLQDLVRRASEAFLARKIIACEGSTEVGFIRKMDKFWQSEEGEKNTPFACLGVVPASLSGGAGSNMANASLRLKELGYEVAYFGDSDVPLNPPEETLVKEGVKVFLWSGQKSIEEQICHDLPFTGLNDLISGAVECAADKGKPAQSVYDSIGSEFDLNSGDFDGNIDSLIGKGFTEEQIRTAIGEKLKDKGWFKSISHGERLAGVVIQYFESIDGTNLKKILTDLKEWANE